MQHMDTIKILIADDHPILRKTLSNYLSHESEIQVVGEVGDRRGLVEQVRLSQPDILLLDAKMPGPSVMETVGALKVHCPDVQILVLTASKNREQVLDLLKAGISGYILKEDDPDELLQAIHTIAAGKEWFSSGVAKVLVSTIRDEEKKVHVALTRREKDVLRLMVTGASNEDVANQLFIATNTVKNHVRSIFRKLNVKTRVEAVLFALQNHLIDKDDPDHL